MFIIFELVKMLSEFSEAQDNLSSDGYIINILNRRNDYPKYKSSHIELSSAYPRQVAFKL